MLPPPPRSTLFPYTTLFRSAPPVRHRRPARRATQHRSPATAVRSEEHTSELQSRFELVCRLLLEKKNLFRIVNLWLYSLLSYDGYKIRFNLRIVSCFFITNL